MLPKKLKEYLLTSPALVRVFPFVIFLLLTWLQEKFGESADYWFYFAKTIIGAGMLWAIWKLIAELKWAISWESFGVGIGVFIMWITLEGLYPNLHELQIALEGLFNPNREMTKETTTAEWNPHLAFGEGTFAAWFFIIVRTIGSSLVVPPLEELVYRSTLYRYIVHPDFEKVSFRKFHWGAILFTSLIFALTHNQWLSGFICGLAYQWLVIRKGRLGDAITAHAITNFSLAIWVVAKGEWQFW